MARPRLLLINKFYHDVGPAGGVGRYLVQEEEDLTAAGWEVIPFAMSDEHARPTPWDRYFVKARDYSAPRFGLGALGDAASLIWNREAARNLEALIQEARPDVAHLHNIYHHLSPSILPVLARHGIPVVMTLHDLRLLCPAIHMLRQDEVCEKCKGGHLHNAVLGKCVKESRAASLLAAVETLHQRTRRMYEETVKVFLCPSGFYKEKYAQWGYPAGKLTHLPNFVDLNFWHPDQIPAAPEKDAFIYFGRISREKGIRTVLDALALWEQGHRNGTLDKPLRFLVAGTGPCEQNLLARISQLGLESVEVLGPLEIDGLRQALSRARYSIMPSRWYENGPMAALESLASGIPLVGTNMGGIPEMIVEGRTGWVVAPGDPEAMLQAMLEATRSHQDQSKDRGVACRKWAVDHADRTAHMKRLMTILEKARAGQ
jgi:glycosyltransferase involved in cell wall biosynthesis